MSDPTRDAVAQARANVESWFDLVTPQTHKDLDALIAAVRAECADRVRLEARLANALRHLDDTLTKHPNSALAADAIHGALAVVNEVLTALEAHP